MTLPFLSADTLAPLRDANRALLVSRATVERASRDTSPGGGANTGARSWAVIDEGADVPCRISPLVPGSPASVADQTTTLSRWIVGMDTDGPAIVVGDRITVTGVNVVTLETWSRVVVVINARGPRTHSAMAVYECEDAGPGRSA